MHKSFTDLDIITKNMISQKSEIFIHPSFKPLTLNIFCIPQLILNLTDAQRDHQDLYFMVNCLPISLHRLCTSRTTVRIHAWALGNSLYDNC